MNAYPISMPTLSCPECCGSHHGWLCHFSADGLGDLDACATHVLVPAGHIIFAEGQRLHTVSVICEGQVKVTVSSQRGRTFLVRVAKRGEILGLSSALTNTPHQNTAEAVGLVRLRILPRLDFMRFMQTNPEASFRAAEDMCRQYRSVLRDVYRLALSDSVASRVAHFLLSLAEESGKLADIQPQFPLPAKQEEIASMLGSSRESITRVLSDLRRRGIVRIESHNCTILRKDALESLI